MVPDLLWLLFHFHQFLGDVFLAKSLVPIHLLCELLGTAHLQQSSMWAGLLLKFHTCNDFLWPVQCGLVVSPDTLIHNLDSFAFYDYGRLDQYRKLVN